MEGPLEGMDGPPADGIELEDDELDEDEELEEELDEEELEGVLGVDGCDVDCWVLQPCSTSREVATKATKCTAIDLFMVNLP